MRLGFARGFIRIPEVKGNVFGLVSKLVLGSCLVNDVRYLRVIFVRK